MKLLNREPTEEMIKAGREFQGVEGYTACEIRNIYRDMYDAANEIATNSEPIVQDMKPVAWILPTDPVRIVDHMNFNANYGGTVKALYSAEQVAHLRGEAEVLQAENEWITAERDELLGALKGLVRAGQKQGFADSYEAEMEAANKAITRAAAEIGKMKGDKS